MKENLKNKSGSAATLGVAALLVANGYLLRGVQVNAQQNNDGFTQIPVAAPVVQTGAVRDAIAIQSAFTQVSQAVEPAVVTITTQRNAPRAGGNQTPGAPGRTNPQRRGPRNFGPTPNGFMPNSLPQGQAESLYSEIQEGRRGGGLGSGMIFRQDGLILTNAHVVDSARTVTVRMADGREFKEAKVIGVDARTDVAVVKVEAEGLPTVQLGDSSQVQVGDWAIAIGNPFGLEHTMTVGVISAKSREVPFSRSAGNYLQTDASINPGNSGGPLLDINGRVIGINNAIYSESGGNVGIGFAIPANTARAIAEQLITSGKVTRSYLGVTIATVDSEVAQEFKLDPATKGVVIAGVGENTPSARAGLKQGDVVQAINGQDVTKSGDLQRLVETSPVGSTAQLKVLRNGQPLTLGIRLEKLPDTE
jgi:serine protease Do